MDNEDLKKLLAHLDTVIWIVQRQQSAGPFDVLTQIRIDLKTISEKLSKEEPKQ